MRSYTHTNTPGEEESKKPALRKLRAMADLDQDEGEVTKKHMHGFMGMQLIVYTCHTLSL